MWLYRCIRSMNIWIIRVANRILETDTKTIFQFIYKKDWYAKKNDRKVYIPYIGYIQ